MAMYIRGRPEGSRFHWNDAKLTKQSQDTAHRDITDLVKKGILMRGSEGGRSTSYALAQPGRRRAGGPLELN
jgi:hypothetical protein